MKPFPLPSHSFVRAMRKGRPGTKAACARELYGARCSVPEISLVLAWHPQNVRDALRRAGRRMP